MLEIAYNARKTLPPPPPPFEIKKIRYNGYRFQLSLSTTVTPFKFVAIKVRGFEIMTYSWPFNFAVSYQNYFTVSYTNVVFSYTVGTLCVKDHQVLRLEHRLGLMEILKNLKRNIFV